ncbi:MAG: CotH kinase family protein, partial [Clostridia bacterium]|nr:CotH kinase family protein [Clostridia bacterium]
MLGLLARSPAYRAQTPVEPMLELEEIWALEDEREESGTPLVVGMRNGDQEMGYDAASDTFYCTIGMETGESWPELALFAQAADGVQDLHVVWVDDYSYDYASDAVRDGWRYELLAYTDTEFAYVGVVFTGLPVVTLHVQADTEIGDAYIPARFSVSDGVGEPVVEAAKVHTRGNEKHIPKFGYRIEFHTLSARGRDKKKEVSVLGMQADTDWLLIANAQDATTVRNHLCFDLWNRWNQNSNALLKQESHLVEVFVQNEYKGIYQLMERVNPHEDIAAVGGNATEDCLIRLGGNREGVHQIDKMEEAGFVAEYQYEAKGDVERALRLFDDYVKLNCLNPPMSDEEFADLAMKRLDFDSALSYFLFMQSCGLVLDNAKNNLYIWIAWENGDYVYRFAPWDMDFGIMRAEYQRDGSLVRYFDMDPIAIRRILDLNLPGSREKLWEIWNEKKQLLLHDEAIENWICSVEDEIYRSGAYLRESKKWLYGARYLDLSDFLEFEKRQVEVIDEVLMENWPIIE